MMRANEADRLYRSAGVPWRAAAMWLNPGMRSLPKPEIDTSSLEGDSVAAVLAGVGAGMSSSFVPARPPSWPATRSVARSLLDDVVWELEAALRLGRVGELVECEAFIRRRLLTARLANDVFAQRRCEGALIEIVLASGDIDASVEHHFRAIALLATDDPTPWTYDVGLALLYVGRGDLGLAREHVENAVATGNPMGMQFAQLPQAWLDLEEDRFDEARVRIAEMAAMVQSARCGDLHVCRPARRGSSATPARRARRGAPPPRRGATRCAVTCSRGERPDHLIVRARVAADLGLSAMVSDVATALQTMIDHGAKTDGARPSSTG